MSKVTEEMVQLFEQLLYEYREIVSNRFIEEMDTGAGFRLTGDAGEAVALTEVDSVSRHFAERFEEEMNELFAEMDDE